MLPCLSPIFVSQLTGFTRRAVFLPLTYLFFPSINWLSRLSPILFPLNLINWIHTCGAQNGEFTLAQPIYTELIASRRAERPVNPIKLSRGALFCVFWCREGEV